MDVEVKEALKKQLKLLSERSELAAKAALDEDLCGLTRAMAEIVGYLIGC